jgi:hypothetical protein
MKASKLLLGGLAGGVVFFLLGWLIYGIILMDFSSANYNQCSNRPEEDMIWWAMILSNFAYAYLLAFIMYWMKSGGVLTGLKVGAIAGFLMSFAFDMGMYSMTTMFINPGAMFVDVIAYTFMAAISGLVIGAIMGSGKKQPAKE